MLVPRGGVHAIRLGRLPQAGELLHAWRYIFDRENDHDRLGETFGAEADLEDKQGHREAAVSPERITLKYNYYPRNRKPLR